MFGRAWGAAMSALRGAESLLMIGLVAWIWGLPVGQTIERLDLSIATMLENDVSCPFEVLTFCCEVKAMT